MNKEIKKHRNLFCPYCAKEHKQIMKRYIHLNLKQWVFIIEDVEHWACDFAGENEYEYIKWFRIGNYCVTFQKKSKPLQTLA